MATNYNLMAKPLRSGRNESRSSSSGTSLGVTTLGGAPGKALVDQSQKELGLLKKGQGGMAYYAGTNVYASGHYQKGAYSTLTNSKTNVPVAGYNTNFKPSGYIGQYVVPRVIGNDLYGKLVNNVFNPATIQGQQAAQQSARPPREELMILADKQGKQELVDEAPDAVAENLLKKRLSAIKMKGRVSMPSSGGQADATGQVLNIASGGTYGLNFA